MLGIKEMTIRKKTSRYISMTDPIKAESVRKEMVKKEMVKKEMPRNEITKGQLAKEIRWVGKSALGEGKKGAVDIPSA